MIPVINKLTALPWTTVIASKDWHPSNHCSFAVNNGSAAKPFDVIEFKSPAGDGSTKQEVVWPVHCVEDTLGSEFPESFSAGVNFEPSTKSEDESKSENHIIDNIILKGFLPDREYYSAFQDIWGLHKTELSSLLRAKKITDVFVVGLAFDYCVLNTAVDSKRLGWSTHVIKEATRPVDPEAWDSTTEKLREKGVDVVSVDGPLVSQVKALL